MYTDNNLFNPQWTQGRLESIAPVVSIVSMISVWIISLGGLFLVVLPIIRFVINAIVVSAPRLCEKVDEAHKASLGFDKNNILGSGLTLFLKIVPNFKALSDFERGIQDPKTFFLKGIPMFCTYTFIGTFVHYGYFSKFGQKFSQMTLGAIDMILDNVDPQAAIEALPTLYAKPKFNSEDSSNPKDKAMYSISKALYARMSSEYSNLTKEARVSLARQIDNKIGSLINEEPFPKYTGDDKYEFKPEVKITGYIEGSKDTAEKYNEKTFTHVFHKYIPVSAFDLGIPDDTSQHEIDITVRVVEHSEKNTNPSVNATAMITGYAYKDASSNQLILGTKTATMVGFTQGADFTIVKNKLRAKSASVLIPVAKSKLPAGTFEVPYGTDVKNYSINVSGARPTGYSLKINILPKEQANAKAATASLAGFSDATSDSPVWKATGSSEGNNKPEGNGNGNGNGGGSGDKILRPTRP